MKKVFSGTFKPHKKKNLTSLMLITVLTIIVSFTIILGASWIYDTSRIFNQDIVDIKSVQTRYIQADLKTRVESVIDYITYRKAQTEDTLKDELQSRTNEAYTIMMSIYNENRQTKSKLEIQEMIVNALQDIRFNDGRGYYFVDSLEGEVILYPINPTSHGTNLLDLQDESGNYVLRDEIALVKAKGEGYVEGYWKKPGNDDKTYRKITFVKEFEPYDWYLGCGDYVDDFTAEVQMELLDYINSLHYGENDSQYVFVHDFVGTELANGLYPELIGTNNYDLKDAKGVSVIQEQIRLCENNEEGFLTHYWENVDCTGQYEKLTYIGSYKEWNWIIGTGISMEYVNETIIEKEKTLIANVKQKILIIIILLIIMVVISISVVKIYILTISKNIDVFTQFMKSSSAHLKEIDLDQVGYDDFDELIVVTNNMTQRINHLLFHDELTGVFNRRYINTKLDELLGDIHVHSLCVMLIDIDYFKRVNDTYGHQVGDEVLKKITYVIEKELTELMDSTAFYIGRFGGEEFLILLSNESKDGCMYIANKLLTSVEKLEHANILESITISAGLCFSTELTPDELIKIADDNLYRAKESGRNKFVI